MKRVLNVLDSRTATRRPRHDDNVKAARPIVESGCGQKDSRRTTDAVLLSGVNGNGATANVFSGLCLDLHENDRPAVNRDQIDLACGTAIVSREDSPPTLLEIACGRPLTAAAQTEMIARRSTSPACDREKPFDEHEVHEAYAPCRPDGVENKA